MPSRPMRRLSGQPAHFNVELETKIPWSGIRMMMKIRMTFTYFILMTQTSDNRELVIIIAYQYIHILWRHARLPWLEGEGANTPLTKEADKLDELELYDSFRFPVWYILNHVKNNIPPSPTEFRICLPAPRIFIIIMACHFRAVWFILHEISRFHTFWRK